MNICRIRFRLGCYSLDRSSTFKKSHGDSVYIPTPDTKDRNKDDWLGEKET